ncbi:MAG: hypothetical protein QW812_02170, partial [Thermoplasmataceae archaeon]
FLWTIGFPGEISGDAISISAFFGSAVTSVLFYIPMIAEMAFFIISMKSYPFARKMAFSIFLMQIADPAVLGNSEYSAYLVGALSVFMIVSLYIVLGFVYTNRESLSPLEKRTTSWFLLLVAITIAGLVVPIFVVYPFGLSWLIFSLSMIFAMVLYFKVVFEPHQTQRARDQSPASRASL